MVEHDLAKVGVAGPSPVSRSIFSFFWLPAWRNWLPDPKGPAPSGTNIFYFIHAQVAELVDALDLKSSGYFNRAGSSPALGTIK